MSNVYQYEPAVNGLVVIETTMGDIEIELWSKEAPKACRNFVGLALEGYYDNNVFHRIVKDFIVQTGDPTGTGHGGESFFGEPFEDEPHQRLKYSRRGLVGMANNNARDTNTSQFFITLDRADELQNKHTIFGRVSTIGNTIFNVLKIGGLETDENERPLYPPKIKTIRVMDNPFPDIVIRITAAERRRQEARKRESAKEREEMAARKKVKKNTKLLAFGDEAEEEESEAVKGKKNLARPDLEVSDKRDLPAFEDIVAPLASASSSTAVAPEEKRPKKPRAASPIENLVSSSVNAEEQRRQEIAAMESSLRALKRRAASPDSSAPEKKTSLLQAGLAQYSRGRAGNLKKGKSRAKEEDDILATLGSFRKKMQSSIGAEGGEGEELDADVDEVEEEGREVDDDLGWMGHRLIEERDEKQDDQDRRAETDYDVIDTRHTRVKDAGKMQYGGSRGRGGRGGGSGSRGGRGGGAGGGGGRRDDPAFQAIEAGRSRQGW